MSKIDTGWLKRVNPEEVASSTSSTSLLPTWSWGSSWSWSSISWSSLIIRSSQPWSSISDHHHHVHWYHHHHHGDHHLEHLWWIEPVSAALRPPQKVSPWTLTRLLAPYNFISENILNIYLAIFISELVSIWILNIEYWKYRLPVASGWWLPEEKQGRGTWGLG